MNGVLGKTLIVITTVVAFAGLAAVGSYAGVKDRASQSEPTSAPASVLSIKADIGHGCAGGCSGIDHVFINITNNSNRRYVQVVLAAFQRNWELPAPRALRVSAPAILRKGSGVWVFKLAPTQTKLVKFAFASGDADSYCAAGTNAVLVFHQCSPRV